MYIKSAAVLLTALLFSSSINADDRLPVFETIGQEPYSYIDENGNTAGYTYEIANAILEHAGYRTKANPAPMKRLLRNMKIGATDCMIAAKSPYTTEHYTFIEELGHDLKAGFVPRVGIDLNSYDDLKKWRIGVPAGMTIGDPFDSDESLTKVVTPDYPKSANMLKYGRIDVIMGAIESIKFGAYKAYNKVKLEHGTTLILYRFKLGLICNNDVANSEMVRKLKASTFELRENGSINTIIQNFFAPIN